MNTIAEVELTTGTLEKHPDAGHSPRAGGYMELAKHCAYNQTRECFLSLNVAIADNTVSRLRGLIGKLRLRVDEGVWIVPSHGIHTIGVLFSLDLIYLDDSNRVIELVEHFPPFGISPWRSLSASVLELPTHTIYSSQTQPGDQLLICKAEEMEHRFMKIRTEVPDTQMEPAVREA